MQQKFHIFHTNDLHSHFNNWPKIATYIKMQHRECTYKQEEFITLDIGDHADRSHVITEGTDGKGNVQLLNQLDYDYVTIGNNEGITFDQIQLNRLYDDAMFKVLLANIKDSDREYPSWAIPHQIHQTDSGLEIGLIGVTAPFYKYFELLGWHALEPIEVVKQQVRLLKDKTDVIILMSHLGLDQDRYIAENIDGIDIILGGHTHHLLQDGVIVNDTLICQAGRGGDYVGHIEFNYSEKKISSIKATCIEVQSYEDDAQTITMLQSLESEARVKLRKPIITLQDELPIDWFAPSPLASFLAETVRDWCEADIGMVNAGLLLDGLPTGEITREILHQICPHPINTCKVLLNGEHLKEIILQSFTKEMIEKRFKGLGFRGEVMGIMVFAGVDVSGVILEDEEFHVREINVLGHPLNSDHTYSVATLDMFTFGSFYPSIVQNETKEYYLPHMLRDLLGWNLKRVCKNR
jgi:5'-nucleotidase